MLQEYQPFSFIKQLYDTNVITHQIITFIFGANTEAVVLMGAYEPKAFGSGCALKVHTAGTDPTTG